MRNLKFKIKNLKLRKRPGITLIELLIYLAITAIVLVVVIDLVTRIAQNRGASQGQTEVTQNARFLCERLSLATSQASAISGTYPANNLNLTINSLPVIFSLENGQIFYQEGGGQAMALTDSKVEVTPIDISENIFKHLANGQAQSVQIRFKITFKQNNFSREFETAAVLEGK